MFDSKSAGLSDPDCVSDNGMERGEICLRYREGTLRVTAISPTIIHIRFGNWDKHASLIVIPQEVSPKVSKVDNEGDFICLHTDRLTARVDRSLGRIDFIDRETGRSLLGEVDRTISPIVADGDEGVQIVQRYRLSSSDALYGLGQYESGLMNYRNQEVQMVVSNRSKVIPFLVSTGNWGLLWDNSSKTVFQDNPEHMSFTSEMADGIDYYLVFGDSMDAVIANYRKLTGAAPLFGKWAYGYWQSREHYASAFELLEVAAGYRERGIPFDNLVQDWNYWPKGEWSGMRCDLERYPDLTETIRTLHEKYHAHFMISIWPAIGRQAELHRELEKRGFLYSGGHWAEADVYDAFHPEAREVYWRHARDGLFRCGVDAWWTDGSEPEFGSTGTQEISESESKKRGRNFIGSWTRTLNAYPLVHARGIHEGQRAASAEKRVFQLTRAAFAGQQRYAAASWSGDTTATWEALQWQVPAGINFSMAGVPYWTCDIGAFFGRGPGDRYGGTDDPAYQELYVRWFQYATFLPLFRAHGTHFPREIWHFGPPGYWAYDTLVKFDRLRYRLMPYIYSLAWKVTAEGYTMLRGLAMDHARDPRTHGIQGQFLFGPSLLVAPVTQQMVYSPKGLPVVPSENLSRDGGMGLRAEYYRDADFKDFAHEQTEPMIDNDWSGGPPAGVPFEGFSVRWSGYLASPQAGEYTLVLSAGDGVRLWVNKQLVIEGWQPHGDVYTWSTHFQAGERKAFKLEYYRKTGLPKVRLLWRTPHLYTKQADSEIRSQESLTWPVYLPAGTMWHDFWSGATLEGGQMIQQSAPLDTIPLFVPEGSIIPLGPDIQYATEKHTGPTELRVYRGRDARFVCYEDEGDGYGYENGAFATIPISWSESEKTLTIEARQGNYPGMAEEKIFTITDATKINGPDSNPALQAGQQVRYTGRKISIQLA